MKKIFHKVLLGISVFCAAAMTSCNDEPVNGSELSVDFEPAKSVALNQEQKAIAKETTGFSNTLFNATSQIKGNDNFVISPLGASMALSMVANVTNENMQDEILDVLNIERNDVATLNSLNKKLLESLPVSSKCDLNIYNSFWYNTDKPRLSLPSFTDKLSEFYQAPTYAVPQNEFVAKANSWISEKTNGGFKNFLSPGDEREFDYSFFNIIDFQGVWNLEGVVPTSPMVFNNHNGQKVDLTSLEFDRIYAWSTGSCFVFDIPYMGGSESVGYSMRIIFPYENVSVNECLGTYKEFIENPLNKKYGESATCLKVYLPKFEISSDVDMVPIFKSMGVKDLFDKDKSYTLDPLTDGIGYVSTFRQATKIAVDERGTKAQTVTQIGYLATDTGRPLPVPRVTRIDRPFAFEIYEASTGVSILQGRINNL